MRRWQIARQGLQSFVLVVLILVSCSAPGSDNPQEGCGGLEATVSCLTITRIAPMYLESETSNVDAFRATCADGTAEPFTDHAAEITFTNTRFPTATGGFDIRILGYTVSYMLNQCPTRAIGCPPLPGFSVADAALLVPAPPPGSAAGSVVSVTATFPFVPLRVKDEYRAAGGELFSTFLPSYTATYVFTAQTTRFNDTFTVRGGAEFTIGAFNNCPE